MRRWLVVFLSRSARRRPPSRTPPPPPRAAIAAAGSAAATPSGAATSRSSAASATATRTIRSCSSTNPAGRTTTRTSATRRRGRTRPRSAPRLGRDDLPAARRHGRLLGSDALRRGQGGPTARRDRLLHSADARASAGLSRQPQGRRGLRGGEVGAGVADHVLELRPTGRSGLGRDPYVQLVQPAARRQVPELLGRQSARRRRPQRSPRVLDQRRLPVDASGGSASAGAGGVLRRRRRPDR